MLQLERVSGVMIEARDAIDPETVGYQMAIRKLDREIEGFDRMFRIIREAEG
jgi:hypothetical protein